ncbi:xanthine dehydrogenase accessory protein XdhC [Acuticoccus sp. MNP-M23]|uniref:xanthine dehydrogenase accessory protein XdhC n=1 Tax=Acuticoccus sp. MNP-M23 TaxID=3072793 RepID=UPI0028159096|nr:xanthine dehydrogenase accessory protein XdhC [Acuticoccus sp. MNP-M23]WMS44489.1 xanthine dehydrogenase accessory protein XdhC [Acuticoccus sp. MNP-M23]
MSEATRTRLAAMAADRPAAVVYVSGADGSTPREVGAFMIVTPDEAVGTIGGGEAERRGIVAARALLAGGDARTMLTLPLGPALDQCCGGRLTLAIARVEAPPPGPVALWPGGPVIRDPADPPVLVYGAGHVGAAVVRALSPLPFAVDWIDPRSESVWPTPADQPCRRLAIPEAAAGRAPPDAIHLVMTHSHAVDLEIVAAVLARPFRFLGLIGSATKRATFVRRLAERGLDGARVNSPIGLPQIAGKAPAIIAASVAAQLLCLDDGSAGAAAVRRSERETA